MTSNGETSTQPARIRLARALSRRHLRQPLARGLLGAEKPHDRVNPVLVHELAEATAMHRRIAHDDRELGAVTHELLQHLAGEPGLEVEEVGGDVLLVEHQTTSLDAG